MVLQVVLILSGNLSFLNWLTILPALFCFDDVSLQRVFSARSVQTVKELLQRDKSGEKYPLGEWTTVYNLSVDEEK